MAVLMTTTATAMTTAEVLAGVERLLDSVPADRSGLNASERLQLVHGSRRLSQRIQALAARLLAEAERADAGMRAAGTPLASWLATDGVVSRRAANGALHRARELAAHPQIADAATSGRVGLDHARVINRVLDDLAPTLTDLQQTQAETLLLDLADRLAPDEIAAQAPQVLRRLVPNAADDAVEVKLQRETEAARRARSLRFWKQDGSVRFDGSLPRVDGDAFIALISRRADKQRRTALEERDPLAVSDTPEQRRADALTALIHDATDQFGGQAPGTHNRVAVVVDFDKLRADAAGAGALLDGTPLSAGEVRLLCCDAGILPAVMRGPSQVLDIGRSTRAVSPAIRAALTLRDHGCAFPGCRERAEQCDAHHIEPWWRGGATALHNLVLLCHHHHGLLEPARHAIRDQWQVTIAADGLPRFTTPARYEAARRSIEPETPFAAISGAGPPGSAR